jgi:multiple sugar transport system substrate-binding protein
MSDRHEGTSRRRLLAAAGTALAGGLAGCQGRATGGGSGGGSGSGIPDSEPLVTHQRVGRGGTAIPYWTSTFYSPSEAESSQPAAAPAIRAQHEAWAEAHPDYRIDLSYQAFDQWKNSMLTRASQGDAPPGSTLDSFWVPDFYEYLQPLNDYVEDVDDFFPFVRETATRDGDLLAAWKYTDCRCLYYRQDLVDRYGDGSPPRTWEDLVNVGGAIAEGEDTNGFLFTSSAFANLPFFWGQGGTLVDDAGAPVLDEAENRDAAVRALAFLKRLVDEGVTPKRTANVSEYETLAREARNGQTAMFVGGNWQIEKDFKNKIEGDEWQRWKVAEIPMRRPDQFATGVGGWTEGAFAGGDSGEAAAVKDFVARHADPEAMGRYCEAAGLLPTRQSVFENSDYYSADTFPYQEQFRGFLEHGVARPAFPIYSTVASEFENAIGAVVTDQATPEAAVETMIGNVNEEYDG